MIENSEHMTADPWWKLLFAKLRLQSNRINSSSKPALPPAQPNTSSGKNGWLMIPFLIVWILVVGVGMQQLLTYELAPGPAAVAPGEWPSASKIQRVAGQPALVMIVHPHCACTRATIGELALIMSRCQHRLSAYVLILSPTGFSKEWTETDLWQSAQAIPGVHVIGDRDGLEARLFNTQTSGQTMLYDASGHLQFSGGITGSRGHSGDNIGRDSIVSLINQGTSERKQTSVFGCGLFNTGSSGQTEHLCNQ